MNDTVYVRLYLDVTGKKLFAQVPYQFRDVVRNAGARWNRTLRVWWWRLDEFEDAVLHLKGQGVRVRGPMELATRIANRERDIADSDAIRSGLVSSKVKLEDHYEDLPSFMFAHQKMAVRLAQRFPQYAFFMDTGTGKTVVGIEIIKRLRGEGRALVVCPLSIIKTAWEDDLVKWGGDLSYALAYKNRAQKLEAITGDADMVVINYESFRILLDEIKQSGPWSILILDESSKIKNQQTKVSRAVRSFAHDIPRRYILTATPAPNKHLEYWAQMNVVDPLLLGNAFTGFRHRYFHPTGYMGYDWSITPEKANLLMQRIRTRAQFVDKQDCLDLPDQVFQNRMLPMFPRQKAAYREMATRCLTMIENGEITATNALGQIMKLRQITSGFVLDSTGVVRTVDSPKYRELDAILEELGGRQVIVWVNFHAEIDALLKRYGDRAKAVYGKVPPGQRASIIKEFQANMFPMLIAHPRTAGHGITMVNAHYAVYFSLSYSLEEYYQSRDRIHRIGQKKKCTYIHLLCEDTIDGRLLEVLKDKGSVAKAAMTFLK